MNPNKLPVAPSAIQRLAQKEFNTKQRAKRLDATRDYTKGDPSEKVWDNYQLTKQLKREFKDLCRKENIVASKYLRACIRILINKKGDVKKALKDVDKIETAKLGE